MFTGIFEGVFKGNRQSTLLLQDKFRQRSLLTHDTDADFGPGQG
jgi:hypothetical protein